MDELDLEDRQMLKEEGRKYKAQKNQLRMIMGIYESILVIAEIAIIIFYLINKDTIEHSYLYSIVTIVIFIFQLSFTPYVYKKMFYMLKMTDLEAGKEKLRLEEERKRKLEQRDKK